MAVNGASVTLVETIAVREASPVWVTVVAVDPVIDPALFPPFVLVATVASSPTFSVDLVVPMASLVNVATAAGVVNSRRNWDLNERAFRTKLCNLKRFISQLQKQL